MAIGKIRMKYSRFRVRSPRNACLASRLAGGFLTHLVEIPIASFCVSHPLMLRPVICIWQPLPANRWHEGRDKSL
jgi:hypothetical protein